ncbi:MAG: DUF402 domain-containing protein [Clostridia bacterium]|nr:DUF402 domain-containing protein [Clostridia bacterium]
MESTGDIKLYRRRFIPDEIIYLKDDEIISIDNEKAVTKWNVLNPRHDFTHGVSCYFIKEGFKISKFLDENDNIVYWYCDIIDTDISDNGKTYVFKDLLIDVIVYENGFVKVVDLEEIGTALKSKIISDELIIKAMERADRLLNIIYGDRFKEYTVNIEEV